MASFVHPPRILHISGDRCRESPANLVYRSGCFRIFGLCKERRRERSLICSRVKHVMTRGLNLGNNVMLYGQLSVSVKETEEKEKQNYYVNMGNAVRTLREEFPDLFYRELSFGIYRDDIVFKDPLNTFVVIENYKSIFWALRFQGKVFFKALSIDIVSVWQPVENMIMIRWTVHAIPRVPWDSRGRFDGNSEYKLDKDGKIYEHRVHNIVPNTPPGFHVLAVDQFIQSIRCPSTPEPTYFEIASLLSITNITPSSEKDDGIQHRLSSIFTSLDKSEVGFSGRI